MQDDRDRPSEITPVRENPSEETVVEFAWNNVTPAKAGVHGQMELGNAGIPPLDPGFRRDDEQTETRVQRGSTVLGGAPTAGERGPSQDAPTGHQPPVSSHPTGWRGGVKLFSYLLLVTAVWVAMSLYGLGKAPFYSKGEPREGLVVWEMTHGGGWILPMSNGELVPSKPPLMHWIAALASLAQGSTDEWSIRFPSALLSLLCLWSLLFAGAALWNAEVGLISSLLLMTTFEWARAATNARVDMALTFGLQAAFLCLLFYLRSRSPRWLVPLYVSIAIAVLGKGLVGAVLPGLVALAMILLLRDWRLLIDMRLLRGAVIVLVLAGLWYVLALYVGGSAFFHKQLLGEQLFTFLDNPEISWRGHRHSFLYLPGALALGLLPWTLFVIGALVGLWQQRRSLAATDARLYLLVWVAVVFGFYEFASSKRSVYLLALYPPLALLVGAWWHEQTQWAGELRWLATATAWLARLLLLVLGLLSLLLLLQGLGVPLVEWLSPHLSLSERLNAPAVPAAIRSDPFLLAACLVTSLLSLIALVRYSRQAQWAGIFVSLLVVSVAMQLVVRVVFLPALAERMTFRDMMREVRTVAGATAPLCFYKAFEYGAIYYWEGHIPQCHGPWPESGSPQSGPRYVLTKLSQWQSPSPDASAVYEKVELTNSLEGKSKDPLILLRRLDSKR